MKDAPLFKYCHACGFEYYAFVDVCTECDAELTIEPLPLRSADGGDGVHEIGEEDVGALTDDERGRIALMLRGLDVPFQLTDTSLTFPRSRTHEVRAQLELVGTHSLATTGDSGPPAATVASVARELRTRDRSIASRSRRFAGAFLDSIVLGVIFRIGVLSGLSQWSAYWTTAAANAAYTIVLTAVSGRTLGKAIARIQVVEDDTGAPPSWARSGVRWLATGWAFLVPLVASAELDALSTVIVTAMYAPILWDRRGRGLHDRIAGTVVVRNRTDTWVRDEDDDDDR